jgi:methylglutaconyl-CoA hydratase
MDAKILDWEMKFLTAAPMATQEAKKLIHQVVKAPKISEDFTCQMIAQKRTSLEGQEGMTALLNKQKPSWIKS